MNSNFGGQPRALGKEAAASLPPPHRLLFVDGFALPLARLRNGLLEGLRQSIQVGHIIAIDRPRLRLLPRLRDLAIGDHADARPVREKFLSDTRQLFPADLDYLAVAIAFDKCLRFQRDRKRNGSNDTQIVRETGDENKGGNGAANRCRHGPLLHLMEGDPQDDAHGADEGQNCDNQFKPAESGADKNFFMRNWRRCHKMLSLYSPSLTGRSRGFAAQEM